MGRLKLLQPDVRNRSPRTPKSGSANELRLPEILILAVRTNSISATGLAHQLPLHRRQVGRHCSVDFAITQNVKQSTRPRIQRD